MAARLDLYRVADGATAPGFDPTGSGGESVLVGFVSASDDDEQALFALLDAAASRTELDATTQGSGRIASSDLPVLERELDALASRTTESPTRDWLNALRTAVGTIASSAAAVAWDMRYDLGGSADDGADEFPTGWS
jgi:hypothetical protein